MVIPLVRRLFRGESEASSEQVGILLADFGVRPVSTINAKLGVEETPVATVVVEPSEAARVQDVVAAVKEFWEPLVE